MHTTVTVKLQAESQGELINTFPSLVADTRTHFELMKTEGVFGSPDAVELRYMVIGETWRERTIQTVKHIDKNLVADAVAEMQAELDAEDME